VFGEGGWDLGPEGTILQMEPTYTCQDFLLVLSDLIFCVSYLYYQILSFVF